MTICYVLGNSIYLNITNRCTNQCSFCVRDTAGGIADGVDLWLEREPTVEEIKADLARYDLSRYDEVVFCGYGEPFMRVDDCIAVAKTIRAQSGIKIRVNTNGHANRIAGRDVTPELKGLFDEVSISLNAKNAEEYNALCHCAYGSAGFDEMLDFAKKCTRYVPSVVLSVVDVIGDDDIEACRKLAESVGAVFRVRAMIQ